jgi:hypothetical protein
MDRGSHDRATVLGDYSREVGLRQPILHFTMGRRVCPTVGWLECCLHHGALAGQSHHKRLPVNLPNFWLADLPKTGGKPYNADAWANIHFESSLRAIQNSFENVSLVKLKDS